MTMYMDTKEVRISGSEIPIPENVVPDLGSLAKMCLIQAREKTYPWLEIQGVYTPYSEHMVGIARSLSVDGRILTVDSDSLSFIDTPHTALWVGNYDSLELWHPQTFELYREKFWSEFEARFIQSLPDHGRPF